MFDNNLPVAMTARFPADLSGSMEALALVRQFLAKLDNAEAYRAKLSIVVEELVLNIVEHGATPAWSAIDLTLSREAGGVAVTLCDKGKAFDPREAKIPDAVPERGGGAGLALVRAWAEVRSYDRVDGVNRLELLISPDV